MKKVLGIDVGGTKIAAALVGNDLSLSQLQVLPTSQTDLVGQLNDLVARYSDFEAIGLAMPGLVLADGTVMRLPNVHNLQQTNFKQILSDKFKTAVEVVNDAKAFAFAEANVGLAKEYSVVAAAVLGTGIGVGVVMDKKIYFGKDRIAGELEHIRLLDDKLLWDHRHEHGQFSSAKDAQNFLKTILDTIILSFNPDIIVLGGGWGILEGMEELGNQLATNVGNYENQTPVKVSQFQYPSLIGAALLAGLEPLAN